MLKLGKIGSSYVNMIQSREKKTGNLIFHWLASKSQERDQSGCVAKFGTVCVLFLDLSLAAGRQNSAKNKEADE